MTAKITPPMWRALHTAAFRERGNICPISGCWANAEQMLIEAMDRRGFITWDRPEGYTIGSSPHIFRGSPRISEAGRKVLNLEETP